MPTLLLTTVAVLVRLWLSSSSSPATQDKKEQRQLQQQQQRQHGGDGNDGRNPCLPPSCISTFSSSWRWEVDSPSTSPTRYFPQELDTRLTPRDASQCVVGAFTNVGQTRNTEHVNARCRNSMLLNLRFVPRAPRELFSLRATMDRLVRLHEAAQRPASEPVRVLFMGDSLTRQLYQAACCELLRSGMVLARPRVRLVVFGANVLSRSEFRGAHGGLVYLEYFEQYKPDKAYVYGNYTGLNMLCQRVDLMVLGWGLHYQRMNDTHNLKREEDGMFAPIRKAKRDFAFVARQLASPACVRPTLVWYGDPATHWPTTWGEYYYNAKERDWYNPNCRASPARPGDFVWAWRHRALMEVANRENVSFTGGTYTFAESVDWSQVEVCRHAPRGRKQLFVIPTWELFFDLYKQHGDDCTHMCYDPFMYHPVWDAVFTSVVKDRELKDMGECLSPQAARESEAVVDRELPMHVSGPGPDLSHGREIELERNDSKVHKELHGLWPLVSEDGSLSLYSALG